jgi:hypothetical protein
MTRPGLFLGAALVGMLATLSGTPVLAVDGPRVVVVPPNGKPPDLFAAEADFCRSEADSLTSSEPATPTIVRSAVVGTVLGAAVGSVFSSRRYDRTGAGAVTGLIMGTAAGVNRSEVNGEQDQRRYDAAYEQCMVGKGNVSTRTSYRLVPSQEAAPTYAAPPPPPPVRAASPPPPPPKPAASATR